MLPDRRLLLFLQLPVLYLLLPRLFLLYLLMLRLFLLYLLLRSGWKLKS